MAHIASKNDFAARFRLKWPTPLYPFLIHCHTTTPMTITPRKSPGTSPASSISPTDSPDATPYRTISILGGIRGPNIPPTAWTALA